MIYFKTERKALNALSVQSDINDIIKEFTGSYIEINGKDYLNYFDENGGKNIKKLRKLAKRKTTLDDKDFNKEWDKAAKKLNDLYSSGREYKSFFGFKKYLGNGKYESHKTCFSEGDINSINRVFVERNKRFKMLVLKDENTNDFQYSRCIVFHAGRHNVYLFNFYGKASRSDFITALKANYGIENQNFKIENRNVNFNIYLNQGGILLSQGKHLKTDFKMVCPVCDYKADYSGFKEETRGNSHYLACSSDCMDEICTGDICFDCGSGIDSDCIYFDDNGNPYCESCFDENFFYCRDCEGLYPMNDVVGDGYCHYCRTECSECGEVVKKGELYQSAEGECYCEACYMDKYITCEGCSSETLYEESRQDETDGCHYCDDCYNDKFVTCKEAA